MRNAGAVLPLLSVVLVLGTSLVASAQPAIELRAVPSTLRVRPAEDFAGTETAELACARGEVESVQIIVTAAGGNLSGLNAEVSPLQNADGVELPGGCATLFREVFINVRHSAPRATCAPGLIPDALVPFVNPYTGEPIPEPRWTGEGQKGPRFGAAGFEVWEGYHQPLWLDVSVPVDAAPGEYTGTVRVSGSGTNAEIPVRLEVWDFALPQGPTHENHFGGVERVARYLGMEADSDAFHTIEDRYFEMMAAHRINPPIPKRLRFKTGEDGAIVVDEATDQALTEFMARYHVTNFDVPRAPFGDVLGADREKAKAFYGSYQAYLEQKGWAKGAYLYMLDEPNDSDSYERVRQLGAMVKEGAPGLRRLVVEQPYVQKPAWGVLDGAIDIWCPLFGFVHEPSVQRVQAQGDEVWSYTALVQRTPPYNPEYESMKDKDPPYWELDFPVTAYRIAPWLNRRYGITGLLYWSAVYWRSPARNPWDDSGFRIRWNAEGSLFYPGDEAGIDGPVASIRLKNLRDGMEDYEYFALLEARGGKDLVEEVVREAVPTWASWEQDATRLAALRRRLAEEIVKRKK